MSPLPAPGKAKTFSGIPSKTVGVGKQPRINANPGSYQSFGTGCKGTGGGPNACVSLNPNATAVSHGLIPSVHVFQVKANANLVVSGFAFLCRMTSINSGRFSTFLYLAGSNGKPLNNPARTGSFKVDSSPEFYETHFSSSITIARGKTFFIGFQSTSNNFATIATTGASQIGTYYWKRSFNSTVWHGPWSTQKFAWKVICPGTPPKVDPVLSHSGVPTLGRFFFIQLFRARKKAPAVLIFGSSKTNWSGLPLPFALGNLGAKGCSLRASMDLLLVGTVANSFGKASIPVKIPKMSSLSGVKFYNQFFVLDPAANSLGLAFSNGGTGTIGS